MKTKEIDDPIGMLKEIEAYLTFRLLNDNPTVPEEDIQGIKDSLVLCLRKNGVEVNYRGG